MPDGNSDPSQLQFYTPPVCDIIERAKQISHCNIVSVNSFPLHADFNHKASEYMNEAIAERCSRGLVIPNGRCTSIQGEQMTQTTQTINSDQVHHVTFKKQSQVHGGQCIYLHSMH